MNKSLQRYSVRALALSFLFLTLCTNANADPPLPPGHPRLQITADAPAPVILHVGAVDRNILALEIEAQRTQRNAVEPYRPMTGDEIKVNEHLGVVTSVELIRNGAPVAYLVGKDRKHVWFFEKLVGVPLDTERADAPATYTLSSLGSSQAIKPRSVHRKSKPIDIVIPKTQLPMRHYVYLELPTKLEDQRTYTLHMPALGLHKKEVTFTFDSLHTRSEAIHVSHIGFRPDDPVKRAYLSVWLGDGGAHAFASNLKFALVDQKTNTAVFEGMVTDIWPAGRAEKMKRKQNYSLTDVGAIDFSSYCEPGSYRISVTGIGCSYPFTIGQRVWDKPFLIAMKGFYHQRSGIALGVPFTTFTRPRPYHPDDGLKVYASRVTLMETRNGLNFRGDSSNFESLNKNVTQETVANAWGGYFDAADWDRRVQHLGSSRSHLELLELFPEYFAHLDLNIPESGSAIPDILDEALFNIDCYRRLQTADGGIRGGIEAAEHPIQGETSWFDSLRVMTYAPGPWSSYYYANVAARAAYALRRFDAGRAADLEQSALRAWNWAEANVARFAKMYGKNPRWSQVIDQRNLAALEFYRLTGDHKWHDRFVEDSVLVVSSPGSANGASSKSQRHSQQDAAFLYTRLPNDLGEPRIAAAARNLIMSDADRSLAFAKDNAWGLASSNRYSATGTGWFSTPDLIPLMRAHYLTGKADYKAAFVRGVLFSVGANPMNMTYTSGVGHEWPRNAMVLDSRRTARAVPNGITVFGQVDYGDARDRNQKWQLGALDWFLVRKKTIYPDPFTWPVNESYWDIHQWPAACEFTPQSTLGNVSYMWGYLAAQASTRMISVSIVHAAPPGTSDLHRFLPNDGNSVYPITGLLHQWPKAGPQELWRAKIGWGKSAVVEANGLAFTATETDDKQWAVCLDPTTGGVLWKKLLYPKPNRHFAWGPTTSPIVDGDRVYFIPYAIFEKDVWEMRCPVICFKTDGTELWRVDKGIWGTEASTPLIEGDTLYVSADNPQHAVLMALNKQTGKLLWSTKVPSEKKRELGAPASLTYQTVDSIPQIIVGTYGTRELLGVHATTGEIMWRYPYPADIIIGLISTPVAIGSQLFVCGGEGTKRDFSVLLDMYVTNGKIGFRERYRSTELQNNTFNTVAIYDNAVFGFGGNKRVGFLHCTNFADGKLLWKQAGRQWTSEQNLIIADGLLFALDKNNELVMAEASRSGYHELGRVTVPVELGRPQQPTIANGRMYLRGKDTVICYQVGKERTETGKVK